MSIDIKLQSIYKSLVEGDFLTKFEALSLSGIDLEEHPSDAAAKPSSPRGHVVMTGLKTLTEEIEKNRDITQPLSIASWASNTKVI